MSLHLPPFVCPAQNTHKAIVVSETERVRQNLHQLHMRTR